MALSRTPTAITANGVSMLVKGAGVNNFIRVPGLANFTMPDETGSTTETQLLDGSVAAAQPAGVGSITGTIGAIGAHPSHQFLEARKSDQQQITVAVVKPASDVVRLTTAISGISVDVSEDDDVIIFPSGRVASMREGQLIAIGSAVATGANSAGLVGWNKSPVAAGDQSLYRVIRSVDPDNNRVRVSPGFQADVTGTNVFVLKNSGLKYEDISCTVSGLGSGDFQSGGNASSSITLQPVSAVTREIEHRTLEEIVAASAYDSVFNDLT